MEVVSLLGRPWIRTDEIRELLLAARCEARQKSHPNPLAGFGRKCFSQNDEDGITIEILRRMGCLDGGTFAEYGVGNGLENNTLILKALGWRGLWVGGERLAFEVPDSCTSFVYSEAWVTRENITRLTQDAIARLGTGKPDVMSVDLDGNDYYYVSQLIEDGYRPKLFIVEYNSKIPPPVRWCMSYDARHRWLGDDYYGASLCSFVDMFARHSYRLVCCNAASGTNAFFVHEAYWSRFADVPVDVDALYVGPSYFTLTRHGPPASTRLVQSLFVE